MRGAMTCFISIISSYSHIIVSYIGPSPSCMVDYHFVVLKFCDDSHWFSTTRCSTHCFTASSSLLHLAFSFSKYSNLSFSAIENSTFSTMTTLRFLLVLDVITFSITNETRFWGSLGRYLGLFYTILFFCWSNFMLHTFMTCSNRRRSKQHLK